MKSGDQNISRRKLLQAATAALVSGVTGIVAPLLSSHSSALAAEKRSGKALIAYYSRTGTTREVANQIQRSVGGDLFELKTAHTYPKEYRATTNQAKREQQENFRPQLAAEVSNADSYDLVFIGYPNWWGTLPMAFFSFLERYSFAGKTLIPFCTHEGSGLGRGVSDIKSLCPKATILEGLALRGGGVENVHSDAARRDVVEWLRKIGAAV
jgi:flavodoxin